MFDGPACSAGSPSIEGWFRHTFYFAGEHTGHRIYTDSTFNPAATNGSTPAGGE
jgi:hypothetical protein